MRAAIVGYRRARNPVLRRISAPDLLQRSNQPVNLLIGMQRGRSETQTLDATRDCGIVDRLDINAETNEQLVTYGLATLRITNQDGYDVAFRRHDGAIPPRGVARKLIEIH